MEQAQATVAVVASSILTRRAIRHNHSISTQQNYAMLSCNALYCNTVITVVNVSATKDNNLALAIE